MTTPTLKNFVNGSYVESTSQETIPLIDPSTEGVYAHSPVSNAQDVDTAYRAADAAFEGWATRHRASASWRFFALRMKWKSGQKNSLT